MRGIAVVIAARNPGPLLAEALASATAQTRPPSAVVVVDDGSTDGSVGEAVSAFPAVTVITQAPRGRSAARNRGAMATDGDLLFLDADDVLRPEALAVLGAALDADPALDMVHGRVFEFVDQLRPPPPGVRSRDAEVFVRLGGSTLVRRSLWDRVGPFDERIDRGEWIDWMSRAAHLGAVARDLPEVVLNRRLHAANSPGENNAPYLAVVRAALARAREAAERRD